MSSSEQLSFRNEISWRICLQHLLDRYSLQYIYVPFLLCPKSFSDILLNTSFDFTQCTYVCQFISRVQRYIRSTSLQLYGVSFYILLVTLFENIKPVNTPSENSKLQRIATRNLSFSWARIPHSPKHEQFDLLRRPN